MIRNLLIDLDDTIFDFKACERQALSRALDSFEIGFRDEDLSDYSKINDDMWKLFERGEISRQDLKTRRFEMFLSRFPMAPLGADFAERYMEYLSQTSALIDGAKEVLPILSDQYDLYAVTNGYEKTQMGRIERSGIGIWFKGIFVSEKVGFAKPKKEFFDYCAAHIENFSLLESVLIGDSPTSDIRGGNEYGLFTVRFNPSAAPDPDDAVPMRTIRSLCELPSLLAEIDPCRV